MKKFILLFIMLFVSLNVMFGQDTTVVIEPILNGWSIWDIIFPGDFTTFASVSAVISMAITELIKRISSWSGKEITQTWIKILLSILISAVYLLFGYFSGKATFLVGAEWYEVALTIVIAGLAGSGFFDVLFKNKN